MGGTSLLIELLLVMAPTQNGWSPLPINYAHVREYAKSQVSAPEWLCLDELWQRESSWQTKRNSHLSVNRSSGAYGIPQALPAEKMASAGDDYLYNPITQIDWGLAYIEDRYGDACKALEHHDKKNWY